jgi:hypothetical protein
MCCFGVQNGGSQGVLYLLPHYTNDECAIQCTSPDLISSLVLFAACPTSTSLHPFVRFMFCEDVLTFQGIQFASYDSLSKILNPQRKHDPFIHCISGGLAGALAAAATNPLDVAKTLLQTRGTSTDAAIRNCDGLPGALRLIYERDGAHGFLRGIRPRVIQMFPSTAICWTVYEFFKHFLYRNGGV